MAQRWFTPLAWLRKLTYRCVPPPAEKPYDFNTAQEYWGNVPRQAGVNPINTRELERVPDDQLVAEFDREVELARTQNKERRVGFALAEESIRGIANPRVIDYGSGIGFYGHEMLCRHPGAHVTFCDINPNNLAAIRRILTAKGMIHRAAFFDVKDEQARDLQFDQAFDMMMSMGVLHHTPHARAIVQRLDTFLKPGGIFVVLLYNYEHLKEAEQFVGRRLGNSAFGPLTDPNVGNLKNPYSEPYDDAKTQALFAGYEMISNERPIPIYSTYRFRKPPALTGSCSTG